MLKHVLLASAMIVAAPAFDQDATGQADKPAAQEQVTPHAESAEPTTSEPATPVEPATPADPAAQGESATTPAQPDGAAEPDRTAQAQQPAQSQQNAPASPAQIATIVEQGFPTYDRDADGNLKTEEFGAWMVALRSASEPAFTGQSTADKEWIGKALAQADTDKSGSVNRDGLKGFLAPQAAS